MWRHTWRAFPRPRTALDGLLALALTVFAQLNLHFGFDNSMRIGAQALAAAYTALATAVLVARRRTPLATAALVAAAIGVPELAAWVTVTTWGTLAPVLVALYSVARHADTVPMRTGAGLLAAAIMVVLFRVPEIGVAENIPFALIPMAVAYAAGRLLRAHQDSHDAAGSPASCTTSSATVSASWSCRPAPRRTCSTAAPSVPACRCAPCRTPGHQTIIEMRRLLGLLRGDGAELTRQPGTAQLSDLVAQLNDAGLPVDLVVEGEPRPPSPGVELALYRVA